MQPSNARSILSQTVVAAILMFPVAANAQFGEEWSEFQDSATNSICGVINTPTFDLTVIDSTGEVVIVNGSDEVVPDLIANLDNEVFFGSAFVGDIVFATDADGLPALFILDQDGFVIDLDEFSLAPVFTDFLPEDLGNTSCDACDFVDDDGGLCTTGGGITTIFCGSGSLFPMAALLLPMIAIRARRRVNRRAA